MQFKSKINITSYFHFILHNFTFQNLNHFTSPKINTIQFPFNSTLQNSNIQTLLQLSRSNKSNPNIFKSQQINSKIAHKPKTSIKQLNENLKYLNFNVFNMSLFTHNTVTNFVNNKWIG